jgi:hypothetical protein
MGSRRRSVRLAWLNHGAAWESCFATKRQLKFLRERKWQLTPQTHGLLRRAYRVSDCAHRGFG